MEDGESSEIGNPNWEIALRKCENILASGTKSMKIKAMVNLAKYSKKAPEHVLSRFIPILNEILGHNAIANNSFPDSLQHAAAYCLKCIACRGDGSLAIEMGRHGVSHTLIKVLPWAEGMMEKSLLKCLMVVVSFCSKSREVVGANGGLIIIVGLLITCRNDVRLYLLEILSALTLLREVRKELIGIYALGFLVEAAGVGSMISRERACQSLGLIGVTKQTRRTLVELGVIPVLVELFRIGDNTMKLVAANSLGVVARLDYIRQVAQAGAIPLYAELLKGPDVSGKEITKNMFCILALEEANAVEIVGHLVRILREDDGEAKVAAADVIWDLSANSNTIFVIRDSGAITILVELLSHGSQEGKLNVSGAFSQLSYSESGRLALADAGAIPILIDLLHEETEELSDNVVESLSNFHEDPLYRDILSDLVNNPSFRNMQNRLFSNRTTDGNMPGYLPRALRTMSVEDFISNQDQV
ncbi:hypothetical protein TSUD_129010 [Trifolium subterraneum]|uniref:Armadillo repeat-containing domain-containing protein n=1 Tax=Trifolium subterraneum TaxID=3900 RepID=A0A2Z6NZ34_TRISU|nr:hypothetical protein TSUD_129010 [Trifolium subterraneum]